MFSFYVLYDIMTLITILSLCGHGSWLSNLVVNSGALRAGAPLIRDFGKPMYAKNFGYDATVRPAYVRTSGE